MNLVQLLEAQRTEILSRAVSALTPAHLAYYEAAGTEQGQKCLEALCDLTVDSIKIMDLTSLIGYVDKVAQVRFAAGFGTCGGNAMKQLGLIFLFSFGFLMLVNCSGHATMCDSSFHEIANCTHGCPFSVESGKTLAALYLQVRLKSGAITWTLRDPGGKVRWEDRCVAGNEPELITTRKFSSPVAGNWYLELDLQDAVGDYCCIWKTQ